YTKIMCGSQELLILNVHGKWYPGQKLDDTDRLEQSKIILEFAQKFSGPKIICGDFNLMPQTQSIAMLEGDYRNLIKDFGITNTRNEASWKAHNNKQYFADYTFVSPEI